MYYSSIMCPWYRVYKLNLKPQVSDRHQCFWHYLHDCWVRKNKRTMSLNKLQFVIWLCKYVVAWSPNSPNHIYAQRQNQLLCFEKQVHNYSYKERVICSRFVGEWLRAITDVHAILFTLWPSSVCKMVGLLFLFDKRMKLQKQDKSWTIYAIASGHQHGTICSSISHWYLSWPSILIKYSGKV